MDSHPLPKAIHRGNNSSCLPDDVVASVDANEFLIRMERNMGNKTSISVQNPSEDEKTATAGISA